MGKANDYIKDGKWHFRAKGANEAIVEFDGAGELLRGTGTMPDLSVGTKATLGGLDVGVTGDTVTHMYTFTGTSGALSTVASGVITTGTITGGTGLAAGDKVFGVPKTLLDTIQFSGFHVPTTNTLNINLLPVGDTGGSLIATAWDIVAIRGS